MLVTGPADAWIRCARTIVGGCTNADGSTFPAPAYFLWHILQYGQAGNTRGGGGAPVIAHQRRADDA